MPFFLFVGTVNNKNIFFANGGMHGIFCYFHLIGMVTKNQTLNTKRQPNFFVVVWNRKEDSLPLVLELKWPHNTLADIWYVFSCIWFLVTFQSNERNICIYLLTENMRKNIKKMGIPMKEFAVYLIVKLIFHIMSKENT